MAASELVNFSGLMDDAKCFALVRQHRWPEGVRCPGCGSPSVVRDGCDDTQPHRQRCRCKACAGRFDDLTGTVLAGHHQPLRVWVLCPCFMGLNLSNRQIAGELGLAASDVQVMTEQLRRGLVAKMQVVELKGEMALGDAGVNAIPVVAAVAGDRRHHARDLVEQGTGLRRVVHVLRGQRGGHDPAGAGVHAQVQRPLRPACRRPVLRECQKLGAGGLLVWV